MRPVRVNLLFLAGSIAWMLPALAFCAPPFPAAALESLGSEEFKDRVQAQRQLKVWAESRPAEAGDRLLVELDAADDPEVRLRLRETLREIVIAEHQRKDGQGYVGIQMGDHDIVVPGDNKLRGGVLVGWVNDGTPAKRAGIQVNDVVVAINDLNWPAGPGAREAFAAEVMRHKPGDKVALEILRGGEIKTVEVVLTARPMGLNQAAARLWPGDGDPAEELRLAEQQAQAAFFERWLAAKRAKADKP